MTTKTDENSDETAAVVPLAPPVPNFLDELNKNFAYNRSRNTHNNKPALPVSNGNESYNGKSKLTKLNNGNQHSSTSYQTMTIRNLDDKWIMIQKNTFTNWVNEQLKSESEKVDDIKFDFIDGVKLVKLVNALQQPNSKVFRRYFKKPINQHQALENITLALNAITDDGIRLVNIGKSLNRRNITHIRNVYIFTFFI